VELKVTAFKNYDKGILPLTVLAKQFFHSAIIENNMNSYSPSSVLGMKVFIQNISPQLTSGTHVELSVYDLFVTQVAKTDLQLLFTPWE
jgi:hypothetical protein